MAPHNLWYMAGSPYGFLVCEDDPAPSKGAVGASKGDKGSPRTKLAHFFLIFGDSRYQYTLVGVVVFFWWQVAWWPDDGVLELSM